MEVLYLFEKIRFPLLDELMLLVTKFGEETAFLVAALIVFWCVDKNRGYYTLAVGFFGTIITQVMKLMCRIPRPWVQDPAFTVVGDAKEAAGGYSFPSGHSQSAIGTFGAIASGMKKRWLQIIFVVICVLVPISRMYLGVHFLSDVLVGSGVSLALICVLRFVRDGKYIPHVLGALAAASVGFVLYVELFPFAEGLDPHNYASALKNSYTLLGAIIGINAAYWIDKIWVNFQVKAIWWAQILKVVVGLLLVLAVKSGLKAPLEDAFGAYPGRAVRYFLIVVVAGVLWPLTFQWFSKLGKKDK